MSRHHSSVVHDTNRIVNDMAKLTNEELKDLYGLEAVENGYYDTTYNIRFDSVSEWAIFNAENDNTESYEHFSNNNHNFS